jgi:acetyltransferase-like isoleucine patch superfamily enzyme
MRSIQFVFKAVRKLILVIKNPIYTPVAQLIFFLNGVVVNKGLTVNGFIKVIVTRRGKVTIGKNLHINSGNNYNIIGRQQRTTLWVEGNLIIGDNVGMSSTAIICNLDIFIGNDVNLGGNTVIYDSDFHAIDPLIRKSVQDRSHAKKKPVVIKNNVFIGAHSTILKGVTIGENSIIGACSVVSKDIPSNEIWAGNPIVFVKKIANYE